MQYLYILKSSKNGKYYIGCTKDIIRRLEEHNKGQNESTKNACPWELVCHRQFDSQAEAFQEEKKIKSFRSGNAFKKIINGDVSEWSNVPLC
ncbi:MAG: GIY-YIG nuclease family protein [Minisyncoccota bacterium]